MQIFNGASIAAAFVHVVLLVTLIARVHKRIGNAGDARDYEALPVKPRHQHQHQRLFVLSVHIEDAAEGTNERTPVAPPMRQPGGRSFG